MQDKPDRSDYQDTEFQRLLVEYADMVERGDRVDRDALAREHPQYANSICEFLDNHVLLRAALEDPNDSGSGNDLFATINSPAEMNGSGSIVWSLARLSESEYPVQFGNYSLKREIDRGGMGIVFEALDCKLNRVVALKIIRSGELASAEELRRFRAEAEASSAIKHPNIIPIFEVGEVHGLIYFTMAFVDGEDLGALLRRQSIAPQEAAKMVAKVADAVATAHHNGVIHRDLKPSNVLVDQKGEPFLIDFGLAKQQSREALTCSGQILGTPTYMAPEQVSGRPIEAPMSCDVYSLGAMLYELLTRQPPFRGPTQFDILLQVLDREPPRPRKLNKQIPRDLESIVVRAMEKAPSERYSSARQFQEDVQRFLLDEPITRSHPSIADRLRTWWRREPILVSHLCGILSVLLIVVGAELVRQTPSPDTQLKVSLLIAWLASSFLFQRLAVIDRMTDIAHWTWAAFDVATYTTLIYLADSPRGLLLVGYPMMIVASGLFYRVRFVVFVTTLCSIGFVMLCALVDDPIAKRLDFSVIYMSGLVVLGLCLVSMIRRVRGLRDYFGGNAP
ncbi:Serine/threonine-protein kinase PrkC [Planctomycetes bacterium CA13]|uniref:non-specific serine/threonine protein kinase n=1 Tax=Novipirellula herctigrandis TaxID=2527986 RepID=A0A5C5YNI3_9BACT|nr:Serine/threonine-protein kinase PrkC [Planctomycetes bacterium CA13]